MISFPPSTPAPDRLPKVMSAVVEQRSCGAEEHPGRRLHSGFEAPREFFGNRWVYLVLSPRARGLSVGVNLNPDRRCNFDCVYCDVERGPSGQESELDVEALAGELTHTLDRIRQGQVRELNGFRDLPEDLLLLRQVAISGDGEPTLSPRFADALGAIVHVRARGLFPFFKIALLTNATRLDEPDVQHGLRLLVAQDEIWTKLDGGSNEYLQRINRGHISMERILSNILLVSRHRPVVIQSLFPLLDGLEPSEEDVQQYAHRLEELRIAGARISLVQICSATRHTSRSHCGHLTLRTLSKIAQTVRATTGLPVEVF
jgi:wyosine [tRNA(Phe)-imidazoG37] synthetase (radical SAM superfamily)